MPEEQRAGQPYLKVHDVAALLQVDPRTVVKAIQRGELRAIRFGDRAGYRIAPADLDTWLERRKQKEPQA